MAGLWLPPPQGGNGLFHIIQVLYLFCDRPPVGSRLPFQVGQSLNPYSSRYRKTFAYSNIIYPLAHRCPLRGSYSPSSFTRDTNGLTQFSHSANSFYLRACLYSGGTTSIRLSIHKDCRLDLMPFGHSVNQSLTLFPFDESLQQLAYVTHSKTFTLTECTGWDYQRSILSPQLRTPPLPETHVRIGLPRIDRVD